MIIYQIYQLLGGFKLFVSSGKCISQNIFFHMIGNRALILFFERGAIPKQVYYTLRKSLR